MNKIFIFLITFLNANTQLIEEFSDKKRSQSNGLTLPEKTFPTRLLYVASKIEQIPLSFLEKIPEIENFYINEEYPLYLSIALENDNMLLGLIPGGDDLGYTHGVLIDLIGTTKSGITFGGSFATRLYTKELKFAFGLNNEIVRYEEYQHARVIDNQKYIRIFGNDLHYTLEGKRIEDEEVDRLVLETQQGKYFQYFAIDSFGKEIEVSGVLHHSAVRHQKFQEETIFEVFVNNSQRGSWFLWESKIGFVEINTDSVRKFLATGIQKTWHEALGKKIARQLENVPSGQSSKVSFFLRSSVGFQRNFLKSKKLIVKGSTNIGFHKNYLNGDDYFFGNISLNTTFKLKNNANTLVLNWNSYFQKSESEGGVGFSIDTKYNFKKLQIFSSFMIPIKIFSDRDLYSDSDPIHRMGIIIPIRKKRSR